MKKGAVVLLLVILTVIISSGCATIDYKKEFRDAMLCKTWDMKMWEIDRIAPDESILTSTIETPYEQYDEKVKKLMAVTKANRDSLLELAYSDVTSNCVYSPFGNILTEGDSAIILFLIVYEVDFDRIVKLLTDKWISEYGAGLGNVLHWINESRDNRAKVVAELRNYLKKKYKHGVKGKPH